MTKTDSTRMRSALIEGLDRYGGDLSRWPDRSLAKHAAEAALADRDVRENLDAARALDRGLDAWGRSVDSEIGASGAIGRVVAAVRSGSGMRPFGRLRWAAAIAVIVCAAGLGSMVDIGLVDAGDEARLNVVVLDPLVFGPMASDD